jgi:hypothetical protein
MRLQPGDPRKDSNRPQWCHEVSRDKLDQVAEGSTPQSTIKVQPSGNRLFAKAIQSRTLFWAILGRAMVSRPPADAKKSGHEGIKSRSGGGKTQRCDVRVESHSREVGHRKH